MAKSTLFIVVFEAVIESDKEHYDFGDLVEVMRVLRSPKGCPWDREQTLSTLKDYCIEEAGEVVSAIDVVLAEPTQENWDELCEELGDLLLQVVFQSQLALEEGKFVISDVIDAIVKKLIRRHPHVFGDVSAETSSEVLANWKVIKHAEKTARKLGRYLSAEEAEEIIGDSKE